MAYLYQEVQNLPGLTGSSKDRQRQLYELLGSPMGAYSGTYDQNIWLLNQIKSGAAQKALTAQTAAPTATSGSVQTSIIDQYLPPAPSANQPFFPSLTEQWDLMQPAAMNAAAQAVDPELQRQYNTTYGGLTRNLASSGAGSFGRGLGQIGSLQAETARQRAAQLYDVAEQYRKGFEDLYYNPTWEDWKNSLTNAKPKEIPTTPSWDEFYSQYGGQLGPSVAPDTSYKAGLQFGAIPGYELPATQPAPISRYPRAATTGTLDEKNRMYMQPYFNNIY